MVDSAKFISVEGTEGSGKSTLIAFAQQYLKECGLPVVVLREPGSTPLGERLRAVVKEPLAKPCLPEVEMLLFFAARLQLLTEQITPALQRGSWVLCDRYLDSTYAYQVCAGGADEALFETLVSQLRIRLPDTTWLLDIDPGEGLRRIRQQLLRPNADPERKAADAFEQRGDAFLSKVCQGFRERAQQHPQRIQQIAANREPKAVQQQAAALLDSLIADAGGTGKA